VIDTGASGTVGNRALQRALAAKAHQTAASGPQPGSSGSLSSGTLSSVTGHVLPVDIVVAGRLQLRNLDMGNVVIAFADAPAFAELKLRDQPAIFMGMRELRAFKRVAIDFSTRKVLFDLADTP
jgi:uncharacterized protein YbjT (DUF2867 family)